MLENFLASLFVGFGVFCGVFLAFIAPEELKPGKKYFIFFRTLLFISLVAVLVFSFYTSSLLVVLLCLVSLLDLFLNKISEILRFGFLGLFFYFGTQIGSLSILVFSLIFLYGLPAGSLLANKESGRKWFFVLLRALIPYLVFLLVANTAATFF
jgi:hypothetical protein